MTYNELIKETLALRKQMIEADHQHNANAYKTHYKQYKKNIKTIQTLNASIGRSTFDTYNHKPLPKESFIIAIIKFFTSLKIPSKHHPK